MDLWHYLNEIFHLKCSKISPYATLTLLLIIIIIIIIIINSQSSQRGLCKT